MPLFHYEAVDRKGRTLKGEMPALSESNLEQKLMGLGLWLTESSIARAPDKNPAASTAPGLFFTRLRGRRLRRELIDFCTVMSYQVKVGIPLVKALEVSRQDCRHPDFGNILGNIQGQLESGLRLHEAMARYPTIFSTHFISVVRSGELSSKLPEGLADLKDYLEWLDELLAEVRQATLYPAIVMTVIFGFVLFLFGFIIPKFAELLDKLHVQQPLLTQAVFATGDVVKSSWWIWLPLLILAVVGVPVGRRFSSRFTLFADAVKLKLPIFGPLNRMLALSRFAHNLSILYRAGLPILQALELCKRGLIGNAVVEKAVAEVEEQVKTGSTISEAMHQQPVFSAMLVRMVATGEVTGNLDEALETVSDYYNQIIPRRIKAIFSILEPLLMLLLIAVVGTVALAIYLPIISLMGNIH